MSQDKKQVLITSHVLVTAAWEFMPPNIFPERPNDPEDRGRRIPALICTAPLSRALVANVFVQTRRHLQREVVDFFLHDKVIPAFRIPVFFVYCVLINWRNSPSGNSVRTVQRISETMPHIQTLDIDRLSKLDGTAQQIALVAALPRTLWSLSLVFEEAAFGSCCFSAGFVTQLAESCTFLQRLELRQLDSEACDVLFSNEKNLFPSLRTLMIWTTANASTELFNCVFTSQVVLTPRMESLEFHGGPTEEPLPAPSLKPLEHLLSIPLLLADLELATVPNFSVLNCCSELTFLLQHTMFTSDQEVNDDDVYDDDDDDEEEEDEDDDDDQQQQPVVIDLSTMPCLTSLGPATLYDCSGVHTLVLPPTLRTVGSRFCQNSTVEHVDFSLCAGSLRYVDTDGFLDSAFQIERFSTLPLQGKIGTVVESQFLNYCCRLRHVDLRGLQGIVKIKDDFLRDAAVEELDVSALSSCTKIGGSFLSHCYALRKVTGCDGLRNVQSCGCSFLKLTKKLEQFDFTALQTLTELGGGFLHNSALGEEGKKIITGIIERNRKSRSCE